MLWTTASKYKINNICKWSETSIRHICHHKQYWYHWSYKIKLLVIKVGFIICSYHDKSMVTFLWSFLWKCKTKFFSWTKCIKNKDRELELSNWNSWKNCVDTLKMSIVNNYRIVIEKSGNIHIIIWYIHVYPKTHSFFKIDVWKLEPVDIGIQKYIYVLLCTFMCPYTITQHIKINTGTIWI